ncbi:hypothetical protein ACIQNK_15010 [Streptomyces sp. NPDC091273]|uniref:hypothetical protein n=1 Tax=Streptomyces sp. NPDC091273 TaxID=3365982 RepID=UPI0037F7C08C
MDLFCGSGNFSHHLGTRLGIAVHASELDPAVHDATRHNLDRIGAGTRLHLDDIRRSRDGRPCLVAVKTNDRIAHDSLDRSFAGAEHLRSITPPPVLPYGANMDFHLYRLGSGHG